MRKNVMEPFNWSNDHPVSRNLTFPKFLRHLGTPSLRRFAEKTAFFGSTLKTAYVYSPASVSFIVLFAKEGVFLRTNVMEPFNEPKGHALSQQLTLNKFWDT